MTDVNKDSVRQYIETVLNQGCVERVDDLFAPALHEQVKRIATDLHTAFPDMHETIETLIAEDDTVAARWVFRGTHSGQFLGIPPTGRPVEFLGLSMYYLREGKIIDDIAVLDLLDAAEQLGATLTPPATHVP
jgi:predicted ester cyclase